MSLSRRDKEEILKLSLLQPFTLPSVSSQSSHRLLPPLVFFLRPSALSIFYLPESSTPTSLPSLLPLLYLQTISPLLNLPSLNFPAFLPLHHLRSFNHLSFIFLPISMMDGRCGPSSCLSSSSCSVDRSSILPSAFSSSPLRSEPPSWISLCCCFSQKL